MRGVDEPGMPEERGGPDERGVPDVPRPATARPDRRRPAPALSDADAEPPAFPAPLPPEAPAEAPDEGASEGAGAAGRAEADADRTSGAVPERPAVPPRPTTPPVPPRPAHAPPVPAAADDGEPGTREPAEAAPATEATEATEKPGEAERPDNPWLRPKPPAAPAAAPVLAKASAVSADELASHSADSGSSHSGSSRSGRTDADSTDADSTDADSADTDDPAKQICAALRLDLGAYVLGALSDSEAQWVRAHVAVCPECRAAYEELAVLPGFLARLTPAEAEASGAADELPPARVFTTAAERVHREKRTRHVLLAAAAALAILTGTLGWALGAEDGGSPTAAGTASAIPPSPVPTTPPGPSRPPADQRTVKASDAASGAAMTLDYRPATYGTGIDLMLSGVPAGTRCQLDVYGTRGRQETASSWVVPEGGYGGPGGTLTVPGATSIPPDEIVSFRITVVGKDETLLSVRPQETMTKTPVARRRISPSGHLRLDI
ncbi:anti-sigma factor family protein [Streptodolium elevatio]